MVAINLTWVTKIIHICFSFALMHLVTSYKKRHESEAKPNVSGFHKWFGFVLLTSYMYLFGVFIVSLDSLCPLLLTRWIVLVWFRYTQFKIALPVDCGVNWKSAVCLQLVASLFGRILSLLWPTELMCYIRYLNI